MNNDWPEYDFEDCGTAITETVSMPFTSKYNNSHNGYCTLQ